MFLFRLRGSAPQTPGRAHKDRWIQHGEMRGQNDDPRNSKQSTSCTRVLRLANCNRRSCEHRDFTLSYGWLKKRVIPILSLRFNDDGLGHRGRNTFLVSLDVITTNDYDNTYHITAENHIHWNALLKRTKHSTYALLPSRPKIRSLQFRVDTTCTSDVPTTPWIFKKVGVIYNWRSSGRKHNTWLTLNKCVSVMDF